MPMNIEINHRSLNEKCAVIGFHGVEDAARLAVPGLSSLQHRGQEGSGLVVSDGETMRIHKDMGLVARVYDEEHIDALPGNIAMGHNRYATHGESSLDHVQPVMRKNMLVAAAHNGNLPMTDALEHFLSEKNALIPGSNDSEMMTDAIEYYMEKGASLDDAIIESYRLFTGAFSLLVMTKDKIAAVRDANGIRPLSIGKINGGYMVASETCAFNTLEARFLRDVQPGELVVIGPDGLVSHEIVKGDQKLDIFEFVYFARPDSMLMGKRVNEVRRNFGIRLAQEYPIKADVVIPIPDSAIPAAEGYSETTGIPLRQGFAKNRYINRTFIEPDPRIREMGVKLKLNLVPEVVQGKRVVLVDDSIVRATTARDLVAMFRAAGAIEVHLMVSSPPVKYPDFYGIATKDQSTLVAAQHSVDEIRKIIGANSLNYLSLDGLIKATELPEESFCTSCFTGEYPIDIGHNREGIIFGV
jgi:amidophosphoribosyltransferase